ncbi:MAG: lipopolysaccharide heptosyltransferase I, partial [Planctomycetota bacterium]|nr:lipopolysaccharide heptosyltransferase I [Planctomycetota bacterium]
MAAPLPERILIIRLGAIGDVVNALVVLTAIKEHHPGVTIGWAVHELALPLVEGHPSLDRVHLW